MALLLAHLIGREGRAKALRSSRLDGLNAETMKLRSWTAPVALAAGSMV